MRFRHIEAHVLANFIFPQIGHSVSPIFNIPPDIQWKKAKPTPNSALVSLWRFEREVEVGVHSHPGKSWPQALVAGKKAKLRMKEFQPFSI